MSASNVTLADIADHNRIVMKQISLIVILFVFLYGNIFGQQGDRQVNVILIIGDGMGLSHISAAYYQNNATLQMLSLPVTGLMSTHAHDDLVTDSGAGGTAISCGVKTYNGAIGVNADTVAVESVLEALKKRGFHSGLLVSSSLTHATPASFYAHQPSRKLDEAIAADFLKSDIDLAIGGGRSFFENRKKDERNISAELESKGYSVQEGSLAFFANTANTQKKQVVFTADEQPTKRLEGRNYLIPATRYALDFLPKIARDNGFFLMIESSQIDWGGHAKNAEYVLSETLELDSLIGDALKYAKEDGNTLVLVLADHETGGLSVNEGSVMGDCQISFNSGDHTASFVPVFAYGPGAHLFAGFYDNTQIKKKILQAIESPKANGSTH